jgi:hypothetical protein
MRALLLALATVVSFTAGAPGYAQVLTVNAKFEINVTGFSGGPNTLPDAVSNIESTLPGTRVAAIAYNNVAGTPGYGAILAQGSNLSFKRLDLPTDKPIAISEKEIPAWMLNWRNQRRATILQSAKVSLAQAIRAAEASQDNAPAVVAGIARSAANGNSDVHAYMVGILRNGRLQRVAVDSETGSVIDEASMAALTW